MLVDNFIEKNCFRYFRKLFVIKSMAKRLLFNARMWKKSLLLYFIVWKIYLSCYFIVIFLMYEIVRNSMASIFS